MRSRLCAGPWSSSTPNSSNHVLMGLALGTVILEQKSVFPNCYYKVRRAELTQMSLHVVALTEFFTQNTRTLSFGTQIPGRIVEQEGMIALLAETYNLLEPLSSFKSCLGPNGRHFPSFSFFCPTSITWTGRKEGGMSLMGYTGNNNILIEVPLTDPTGTGAFGGD